MSKFIIHKNKNYTSISNSLFRDLNLSLKAKGLLGLMLTLPDDWDYSIEGLATMVKEGKDSVRTILLELIENKYVVRTQEYNDRKQFSGYNYDIYEQPYEGTPYAESQYTGNTYAESPTQQNKDKQNKDEQSNDEQNVLKKENILKERNDETIEVVNEVEQMFNEFWKVYPKKVDPKGSYRAFKNVKGIKKIFPTLMQALEIQKHSKQWQNRQYIPNPTTWLHQERWVDENIDVDNKAIINHIPTGGF